ncbi:MAG: hypothetical protein PHQ28_05015 [Mycobacterium sp.]|nr:hypothetical protein [Mycobacterium sp.]
MGDINYNLAGIEANMAAIHGIHAHKQDLSNQMVGLYTHLDSIASGRATDAGMDFSAQASHARAQEAEVIMALHQGIGQASEDLQGVDHGFMGAMGV